MEKKGFDDWAVDQEVEYILIAKVNGQVAYKYTDQDPNVLIGQVRHAEEQVAQLMNDQYEDTKPDYDAEAEDMRMQEAGEIK